MSVYSCMQFFFFGEFLSPLFTSIPVHKYKNIFVIMADFQNGESIVKIKFINLEF